MGFLSNLFGIGKKTATGNATENVKRSISQSCASGNVNSVVASDISIRMENVDCTDINLIMQSVSTNQSCVETASIGQVADAAAAQIASAERAAGKPVKASLFGINVDSSDLQFHEKIREAIQQKCGDNNTASTVYSFRGTN